MEHISTSPNFVHYFRQKCILRAPKNAAGPQHRHYYTQIKRNDEGSTTIEKDRRTASYKNSVVQNFDVLFILLKLSVILREFYITRIMIYGPKNMSLGTIFLDIAQYFISVVRLQFGHVSDVYMY